MNEFQGETVTVIDKINVPYGKEIELQNVTYENGFSMLRLRIKEGKRYTMIDLDPQSAAQLGGAIAAWAAENQV